MSDKEVPAHAATIAEAQGVVRSFLEQTIPEVRRVSITRMAKPASDREAWEAEADVWQPNATVQALHLETQRPVLDRQHYLVRMDALLNVVAYELANALGDDG